MLFKINILAPHLKGKNALDMTLSTHFKGFNKFSEAF